MVQAITLEDYNREAKKDETLEDREALVFFEDSPIQQETFSINDMHWKVRQLSADSTMEDSGLKFYVTPVYRIVVKDFSQLQEIWKSRKMHRTPFSMESKPGRKAGPNSTACTADCFSLESSWDCSLSWQLS